MQTTISNGIAKSAILEAHLDHARREIEAVLPEHSNVSFHIKKAAPNVYEVDMRARLRGRFLSVSARQSNLLSAITQARRHLTRKIEETIEIQRDRNRKRIALASVG
jgi:ribosome-associated translation inhibitor RaiA